MNCLECQEWLQRRLDGEVPVASSTLEQHLAQCASCRVLHACGQFLLKGLRALPAPVAPMDFSQRMTALVVDDRRARRRRARLRLVVTTLLAASVLLMALAGYFLLPVLPKANSGPKPIAKENKKEPPDTIKKAEPSPRLANSLDDARQVVAALSERWADQAKEQTRILLSAAQPLGIPDIDKLPSAAVPLEPAAQALQQAGQGALESLQPMAMSTRRALSYLFNELPILEGNH